MNLIELPDELLLQVAEHSDNCNNLQQTCTALRRVVVTQRWTSLAINLTRMDIGISGIYITAQRWPLFVARFNSQSVPIQQVKKLHVGVASIWHFKMIVPLLQDMDPSWVHVSTTSSDVAREVAKHPIIKHLTVECSNSGMITDYYNAQSVLLTSSAAAIDDPLCSARLNLGNVISRLEINWPIHTTNDWVPGSVRHLKLHNCSTNLTLTNVETLYCVVYHERCTINAPVLRDLTIERHSTAPDRIKLSGPSSMQSLCLVNICYGNAREMVSDSVRSLTVRLNDPHYAMSLQTLLCQIPESLSYLELEVWHIGVLDSIYNALCNYLSLSVIVNMPHIAPSPYLSSCSKWRVVDKNKVKLV